LHAWSPAQWPVTIDWQPVLQAFLGSEVARQLSEFIQMRLAQGAVIYPPQPLRALALTPLSQVRVVILGQDPYHGLGQAEGLAFSVAPGVKPPPSLRNIFKELAREAALGEIEVLAPRDGSLVRWAQQGVLLINTCLTVEDGQPASHARRGWEALTDAVVQAVARQSEPVVFMLWGAHAQTRQGLIAASATQNQSPAAAPLVLTSNHPSPLSALRPPQPYLGCGHFGLANTYLKQHGKVPIIW
jgi:uracil-DNA glycosylase